MFVPGETLDPGLSHPYNGSQMDLTYTPGMHSSEFMQRIPLVVRRKLPPGLRDFQWRARSYLIQLYYGDPDMHFEVWSLKRLGRLEMGLHFESEDGAFNERMFLFFDRYIIELKAKLGQGVELERWDRGWSRIFESIPLSPFDETFLESVSTRLAEMISLLQPLCEKALLDNSR